LPGSKKIHTRHAKCWKLLKYTKNPRHDKCWEFDSSGFPYRSNNDEVKNGNENFVSSCDYSRGAEENSEIPTKVRLRGVKNRQYTHMLKEMSNEMTQVVPVTMVVSILSPTRHTVS
jgi:hypothetical protein